MEGGPLCNFSLWVMQILVMSLNAIICRTESSTAQQHKPLHQADSDHPAKQSSFRPLLLSIIANRGTCLVAFDSPLEKATLFQAPIHTENTSRCLDYSRQVEEGLINFHAHKHQDQPEN